jgi:hypothetical protein
MNWQRASASSRAKPTGGYNPSWVNGSLFAKHFYFQDPTLFVSSRRINSKWAAFRSSCSANLFRLFLCRPRSFRCRREEYLVGHLVHKLFFGLVVEQACRAAPPLPRANTPPDPRHCQNGDPSARSSTASTLLQDHGSDGREVDDVAGIELRVVASVGDQWFPVDLILRPG